MDESEKVAAWDRIAAAWAVYCAEGAGVFDWDDDSRTVMAELTGRHPFEFMHAGPRVTSHGVTRPA